MARKTTPVVDLVEYANRQLRRTDKFATKEYKTGIIDMIEQILHTTDNYAGFMFIDNDDSDCDTLGYYSRQYFYSQKMYEAAKAKGGAA